MLETMRTDAAPKRRERRRAQLIPQEDGRHTVCGRHQLGHFSHEGLILFVHHEEYLISWSEIGRIISLFATRRTP